MGEINCNQQSADLDGEANLCTKLRDLCFNDFYWCFVVLLFIIIKYFGRCSNEKQSMKSARLMRPGYSPKVVMDRNRNMTGSSLSSPLCFLVLLQLLVALCIFNQMCVFPEKQKKNQILRVSRHLSAPTVGIQNHISVRSTVPSAGGVRWPHPTEVGQELISPFQGIIVTLMRASSLTRTKAPFERVFS